MNKITETITVGGKQLSLEHGRFALQANSAIMARYGDTMVLATVVAAPLKQELDYFPLTVEYMERLYAGGRIKGSRWVKREGRPSDEEVLTARLVDRSIRPLFPKSYKKDVQVIITVLSVDSENDPRVLAVVAASAALATSNIPWNGPIGALRIGNKNGTFFANPTDSDLAYSDLDLVISCGRDNILMIEAGAQQVAEDKILGAIAFGQKEAQNIIDGIESLAKKIGVKKDTVVNIKDEALIGIIDKKFGEDIDRWVSQNATKETGGDLSQLKAAIIERVGIERAPMVSSALEYVARSRVRAKVLSGKRLDGRKHSQVRDISGEVGILPRTHGSAFFLRGQTHVLTATTLGSPSMEQLIESAEGEETKRYIHHYSMPPYSIGETGRVGSPSRREVGHGALAERALLPVIPRQPDFPYTIRVVSEVMSSNGSTSMGSVCGSTMSLMDAGVPITAPVSGIAMGLVIEGKELAILSDIVGIEDGAGDMDFKVAGTRQGVTALQLDVKTTSLTHALLAKALAQALVGRLFILEKMLAVIDQPRPKISEYAPKIVVVKVPVEKIGEVIGPGGRMIKKIMLDTGTQVDMADDGSATISGVDEASVIKAKEWISGMVREVQPGEQYEGEVKRILPFGAFVEILPGKEGLVHISDMSQEYVQRPEDVVAIGQQVTVWVKEKDDLGRLNLSMRAPGTGGEPRQGGGGGNRLAGGLGRRGFDRRLSGPRRGPAGASRAPHFPTSRFLPRKDRY